MTTFAVAGLAMLAAAIVLPIVSGIRDSSHADSVVAVLHESGPTRPPILYHDRPHDEDSPDDEERPIFYFDRPGVSVRRHHDGFDIGAEASIWPREDPDVAGIWVTGQITKRSYDSEGSRGLMLDVEYELLQGPKTESKPMAAVLLPNEARFLDQYASKGDEDVEVAVYSKNLGQWFDGVVTELDGDRVEVQYNSNSDEYESRFEWTFTWRYLKSPECVPKQDIGKYAEVRRPMPGDDVNFQHLLSKLKAKYPLRFAQADVSSQQQEHIQCHKSNIVAAEKSQLKESTV